MLLVCMKCVNCFILFLIPSMLSCSMFMLCVLVSVLLLGGVQGVVWRRGLWWSGLCRGLMFLYWLCVWCVGGCGIGGLAGGGFSFLCICFMSGA